jgi:hypothetical protein
MYVQNSKDPKWATILRYAHIAYLPLIETEYIMNLVCAI